MATVTGTVKDPSGNLYTRATILASFIGQNTTPGAGPYVTGGVPSGQFETIVPGSTDSFGVFSMQITGNDTITPTPSTWKWTVVSSAGTTAFSVNISISGASQDISAALQAAAASLVSNTAFGNITTGSITSNGQVTVNVPGNLILLGDGTNGWLSITSTLAGVPSTNGEIRLDNLGMMNWRNAANTTNWGIGLFTSATGNVPVDTFGYGGPGINGHFLTVGNSGNSFNVATTGDVRIASSGALSWRNNANSADLALSKNASDQLDTSAFVSTKFSVLLSANSNPAAIGQLRLSNADMMNWRNNANNADIGIGLFTAAVGNIPVDTFGFGGPGTNSKFFTVSGVSNNVAASGGVRLPSGDSVSWRNNANGADVALSKNTGDNLVWPNGLGLGGGSNLATTNQTGTGSIVMSTSPTITTPSFTTGFQIGGTAASGNVARGNGTNFVSAILAAADLSNGVTGSGAVVLATSPTITTPTISGAIPSYNSVTTAGQGVSLIVAAPAALTAQSADVALTTLYSVPASGAGMYRASCYVVLTAAAATSSTMPGCKLSFTDNDTNVANNPVFTQTGTGNVVGSTTSAWQTTGSSSGTVVINAKASTNIQYGTSGYASNPAATAQFAIHVKLEYLGS